MTELEKIISEGEGQTLDFKFRIDDQKKIARTLVAFANSNGGRLLIGVKDNGKIVGVDPEEEYYMIEGAASLYSKPEIGFSSKVWHEGHHLVLEIEVAPSEIRHTAPAEDGMWKPYYRIQDQSVKGNKVLDCLWSYRNNGINRAKQFSEDELAIISKIQEEDLISISKIYRGSNLKMPQIDAFVAALVYWDVLEIVAVEDGIKYRFSD